MAFNSYKKFSKNKSAPKNNKGYSELNPHSLEAPVMRNKNIIVTSIDPGIVNCGIYVCAYNTETKNHRSIYLERLVFNEGDNHYIDCFKKFEELEEEHNLFSRSHYIVVESQMTVNYDLVRMGQHMISYFLTRIKDRGNRPLLIEINSQSKTKLLECPVRGNKYEYKKWCIEKAISYLKERDNFEGEKNYLFRLESKGKRDDMSDAICQYYAFLKILEGEYDRPTLPVKRY